ncbi:MAG: N-acetyl-gamma-glutamyl-phosphate reductase [Candidatus Omnitrophica bacterium]|nr:N-acetyl-gamma-glutamyl-phosphate reductase [Candidatus Omnitrophota bacterium]
MIKVGIIGATGYTGEELVKILAGHKDVKIAVLQAIVEEELPISDIFPSLAEKIDLVCKKPSLKDAIKKADLFFLALPHTVSMTVAPKLVEAGKKVIDLSADYRLEVGEYERWYGIKHKDIANIRKAVYGMPELYGNKIKGAKLIANPGCYPTSALLATMPLVKKGAVNLNTIIIDSKSGTTGAGRKATIALSHAEVNENLKAYKINEHQHKPEINMVLGKLSGRKGVDVLFVPHLIPMNRGILSTVYMDLNEEFNIVEITQVYKNFYKDKPFVRVMDEGTLPEIKDVRYTNFCNIGTKVTGNKVVVVSCIDNLLKGAAGQAVQNMNIMYGLEETEGLL